MDLNNYMLVSLNKIANRHDYKVTEITSIDKLSSFTFKKDGIKNHLLLRNVLVLKPNGWNVSKLCIQFNAHGQYRLIEHKYGEDWIPSKLMHELSKFISTSFSILIQHDSENNYLVGIMEKRDDFYYYARRHFSREIGEQNNKYITKDMVKMGFLYGDFYSEFKISETQSKEFYEKYKNVAPCFYIDIDNAKDKQEGEKYCIDCGNPYHIITHPKTNKKYKLCVDCYKVHKVMED